jgi:hypothetical protein
MPQSSAIASPDATAELGAGQAENVADRPDQGHLRTGIDVA